MAKTPKKAGKGRPKLYSKELAAKVCVCIMNCESLRKIGAKKGMPSTRTIVRWLHQEEDFWQHYTRAREVRSHVRFDKLGEIADGVLSGKYDPAATRVYADIEKWALGKESSRYKDKAEVDHTGRVIIQPAKISKPPGSGEKAGEK